MQLTVNFLGQKTYYKSDDFVRQNGKILFKIAPPEGDTDWFLLVEIKGQGIKPIAVMPSEGKIKQVAEYVQLWADENKQNMTIEITQHEKRIILENPK